MYSPSFGRAACWRFTRVAGIAGLACLALVQVGRAQDAALVPPAAPVAAPQSEREALVEQGISLRQQARDDEALALFQRAAQLGTDGRVLAQIAFAEQAMGRWAESYMHLTAALADRDDPWILEHGELLRQELVKIEGNVGRLDVRTNVAVARLTIDGKEVGTTPLSEPIVVTAGAVVISAQASGYLSTTRRVPVHAGALSRTELILVPEPVLQRQGSAPTPERMERRTGFLYAAGAGALVAIVSVGTWVRSGNLAQSLKDHCSLPMSCPNNYEDDRDKVKRLDNSTTALLVLGLSTSVAAAATYWFWPRTERTTVQPSASISTRSFNLGARVTF